MRHVLEILKEDLGCNQEKKFGSFGLARNEPAEHLQFPHKLQRQKSEEFLKAMDLIANEAALTKPPLCSNAFQKVEGKEDFSRGLNGSLNAGLDPPLGPAHEESSATSHITLPTLGSTTCEADFDTSESLQELDELQESMTESLRLTTGSAEQMDN